MCYGYGTAREILFVFDGSASMLSGSGLVAGDDGSVTFEYWPWPSPGAGGAVAELSQPDLNPVVYRNRGDDDVPFVFDGVPASSPGTWLISNVGDVAVEVFREVIPRVECRCPRWGYGRYFGSWKYDYSGFFLNVYGHRFRRGLGDIAGGIPVGTGGKFDPFSDEDPLLALEAFASCWGDWAPRWTEGFYVDGAYNPDATGRHYQVFTTPDRKKFKRDPETGLILLTPDGRSGQTEWIDEASMGGKPLPDDDRYQPPQRVIVWLADEPSIDITSFEPDESGFLPTESRDPGPTIEKLKAARIAVVGFVVSAADPWNLAPQMARVCEETGGSHYVGVAEAVSDIYASNPTVQPDPDLPPVVFERIMTNRPSQVARRRAFIDRAVNMIRAAKSPEST